MSEHVISGLLKKRKELADQLAYHQRELDQAKATLSALDSTIRIYKPDHDVPVQGSARRTKTRNRYFDVGEAPQLLRDYFRQNKGPQSSNSVVYALAIVKGFDYDAMEPDKRQALYKSIMKTLKRACVGGWLVESYREQGVIHWALA